MMAGTLSFSWKLVVLWLAVVTAATALRPIEEPEDPRSLFRETKLQRGIPKYKLPANSLIPKHYALEIQVILDEADDSAFKPKEFTALGKITIDFLVNDQQNIAQIVLNAVNITIPDEAKTKITYVPSDGSPGTDVPLRTDNSHVKDAEREFLTIFPAAELLKNENYRLVIEYEAWIIEPERLMAGLYRTSYIDESGATQWLAVTDFESVDARRMTPCFDEPHLKATWQLTAIHRSKYEGTISNTDVEVETPGLPEQGWTTTKFNPTPEKLSTYLVGLCVSNYAAHVADATILPGTAVKSWGPKPLVEHTESENTANWVANLIKAFNDQLGIAYSFPKMDSIALQDFSAGAMENWGMNTYRTIRILFLTGEGTWDDKFRMTNTISHELAHQWFGNLVTMKWWNEIWLNEGFATFMSNIGVDKFKPGYQQKDWIVIDSVQYAFLADARPTTHPLNLGNLTTPTQTRNGFSTISYDKGASVIRMVNQFLGEGAFWQGVKQYLQDNSNGNVEQSHLSSALQVAADADASVELPLKEGSTTDRYTVDEILDTWTSKSGFPYIDVSEGQNEITVKQSKFRSDGTADPEQQGWIVPVTYRIGTPGAVTNPSEMIWLTTATREKKEPVTMAATDFLIVNPEQHGYYRVKYSDSLRQRIYEIEAADWLALEATTRSAVIDDMMNLGVSGHYAELPKTLCILKKLKGDMTYFPWYSALTNLANVNRMLSRTGTFYDFKKFMMALMSDLKTLGIEKQPGEEDTNLMDTIFLRNRMVEWLCRFRDTFCVSSVKEVVNKWFENDERPHNDQPDLRPYTYCTAMAEAGPNSAAVLESLLLKYTEMKFETDKLNLAKALGCSLRTDFIAHILEDTLNGSEDNSLSKVLTNAHKLAVFQSAVTNPTAIYTAFNFVRNNVVAIVDHLGRSAFASIISSASTYLYTTTEKGWLETLLKTHAALLEPVRTSIVTSINNVQANVNWHARYYQDYRNFFMNHQAVCEGM